MSDSVLSDEFLAFLQTITGKRARVVIDHILQYGYITTEELETFYGYRHPPRAIRDVRENGVPIETFRVKNVQGRSIAAYRFGNFSSLQRRKTGGRKTFPIKFKNQLYEVSRGRCAICNAAYAARYLQIDHRVPYEIAGETDNITHISDYMLVCATCNRAKSWSCEHCTNWQNTKDKTICQSCYWYNPVDYEHIEMEPRRRITLVWSHDDVKKYEEIFKLANEAGITLSEYTKLLIEECLNVRPK